MIMDDFTTSAAFKAAEMYEEFIVRYIFKYWTPLLLHRAAPQLGERVLDVACGTGVVARSMVPVIGPQGKVHGLDKNPAMLEVACEQYSYYCDEIEWREGIAENLPYDADTIDLLTCQQGLQFFSDRPQAAREMKRVLRPGGRAVIEVWQDLDNPFYKKTFGIISSALNVPLSALAAPYAYGDPGELAGLLRDAGFAQVHVEVVTQDVFFPRPGEFIEKIIRAAGAVIPAFAQLDARMQDGALGKVQQEAAETLREHTTGGVLTFPMKSNIAVAVC
jgi:ubiquinone/menaquinone biosynthesis C-methylase UbiE